LSFAPGLGWPNCPTRRRTRLRGRIVGISLVVCGLRTAGFLTTVLTALRIAGILTAVLTALSIAGILTVVLTALRTTGLV
jgi:hypothetical protein